MSAWKPVHKNRNGNDDVRRVKEGGIFSSRDISDLLTYRKDLRLFPGSSNFTFQYRIPFFNLTNREI